MLQDRKDNFSISVVFISLLILLPTESHVVYISQLTRSTEMERKKAGTQKQQQTEHKSE